MDIPPYQIPNLHLKWRLLHGETSNQVHSVLGKKKLPSGFAITLAVVKKHSY